MRDLDPEIQEVIDEHFASIERNVRNMCICLSAILILSIFLL